MIGCEYRFPGPNKMINNSGIGTKWTILKPLEIDETTESKYGKKE